jgi:prophage antirepressor-like protein
MKNIIPFKYDNNEIRIILIDNEPWFVANDITAVLQLSNSRKAISDLFHRLDKAELSKEGVTRSYTLETKGGNQKTTLLSETGFYELVFASKKEEAIRFRYWVTSEVLPLIRRTGSYSLLEKETSKKEKVEIELLGLKMATEILKS